MAVEHDPVELMPTYFHIKSATSSIARDVSLIQD